MADLSNKKMRRSTSVGAVALLAALSLIGGVGAVAAAPTPTAADNQAAVEPVTVPEVTAEPKAAPAPEAVAVTESATAVGLATVVDQYIVGGAVATIATAPWQVALLKADGTSAYQAQFCGGSLISTEWIVTAAHCAVSFAPSDVLIQLGSAALSTTALGGKAVSEILVHPDYSSDTLSNDIALMRLAAPIAPVVGKIQPISLVAADPPVGAGVLVTGWGATDNDGTAYPAGLRKATLTVLSDSVCSDTYTSFDSMSTLCAGKVPYTVTATCFGDSGGPLAYLTGGKWKLAGLVSYGSAEGCISGAPDGFTRVSGFVDWIGLNSSSLAGTVSNSLLVPAGDAIHDTAVLSITDNKAQAVTLTLDPDTTNTALGSLTLALSGAVYRATTPISLLKTPFRDLSNGNHIIRANTAHGVTDISFAIQEGEIASATATTDAYVYYPAKDGFRDAITVTLDTRGLDGTAIPFRQGFATLFVDEVQRGQCSIGDSNAGLKSCAISVVGMGASSVVSVTVSYQDLSWNAGTQEVSGISFENSFITDAVVSSSESIVYPVRDGYLDSTVLTVDIPSSADGAIGLVSSKVVVKRGTKTVLTWNLTKSGTSTKTWNGKDGTAVVAGTYRVTLTAQGVEGDRFTSTYDIVVNKQKLVTKAVTKAYTGKAAFPYYDSFDDTSCMYGGTSIYVWTDSIDETYCYGEMGIPAAIVSQLEGGVTLTTTLVVDKFQAGSSCGSFSVGGTEPIGHPICRNKTFVWNLGLIDVGETILVPQVYAPIDYTEFRVTKLIFTYTYKVLV